MRKIYLYIISIFWLLFVTFNVFSTFTTTTTTTTITPVSTTSTKIITTTTWSTNTWSIINNIISTWSTTIKVSTWSSSVINSINLNNNCVQLGWQWAYAIPSSGWWWFPDENDSYNDPYKDLKCCAWLTFVYPIECNWFDPETWERVSYSWCRTKCAKVWDWICDSKYENIFNSSDCDKNWCDSSVDYICWVKAEKQCISKWDCSNVLVYKTFNNQCLLTHDTGWYVLYNKWRCEDITKWPKELSMKIKGKLDKLINIYIIKLELNYNTKTDKINDIKSVVSKLEDLEISNPVYIKLTQYTITKLKTQISKIQKEEDLYIDEILKIFN